MPLSLKEQLKEKDNQIAMLMAISRISNTTTSLDNLLQELSELIAKELEADSVLIYLFDEAHHEVVLRGCHSPHPHAAQVGKIRLKLGEGITGWVAEKKKIVVLNENANEDPRFKFFNALKEDRYEAFISVPILLKNDVVGVINLHYKQPRKHSEAKVNLAQTIAHEIAGAIEHTRLFDQAQLRAKQINALAKVSKSISQGVYIREILQLIVTMTAELMGSKICSLMLLDEKTKELKIEATQSLSEEYRSKAAIRVTASVSGRAIQERQPIVISDVLGESQYAYPSIAKKEGLRSLLIVPMLTKEKAIGVLNCYTAKVHVFTEEEIQLVQAVANQAAVAIEHTRALEKAVEAQEALEVRKLVERAKGILMRRQGLSEEASFRIIQKQAMDRRKSMKEVAEAVILSEEIQKNK